VPWSSKDLRTSLTNPQRPTPDNLINRLTDPTKINPMRSLTIIGSAVLLLCTVTVAPIPESRPRGSLTSGHLSREYRRSDKPSNARRHCRRMLAVLLHHLQGLEEHRAWFQRNQPILPGDSSSSPLMISVFPWFISCVFAKEPFKSEVR
jgi:hypothetical protein